MPDAGRLPVSYDDGRDETDNDETKRLSFSLTTTNHCNNDFSKQIVTTTVAKNKHSRFLAVWESPFQELGRFLFWGKDQATGHEQKEGSQIILLFSFVWCITLVVYGRNLDSSTYFINRQGASLQSIVETIKKVQKRRGVGTRECVCEREKQDTSERKNLRRQRSWGESGGQKLDPGD